MIIYKCDKCDARWQMGIVKQFHDMTCKKVKPKPVMWIPANAEVRNPSYWDVPDSLCRTCAYQFFQEPFCKTVSRQGNHGTFVCNGYEKETKINKAFLSPSYTVDSKETNDL